MDQIKDLPGKNKVQEYKNKAPKKPLVSVVVTAYNHEKYISECLESILNQETNFDYEILLGEDNSPDNTRTICMEYAKKHPDKIRLFLHDRSNVIHIGGNPTGRYNMLFGFLRAKGKYIALCEGDDYWTDKLKLQRQADFLEKHQDHSLCFHPTKVFFENKEKDEAIYPKERDLAKFTAKELLKTNFIQTNSVMYRRREFAKMPAGIASVMPGDWLLHVYHARFGKIGFIDKVMAAYRKHPGGIWWEAHNNRDEIWKKYGIAHIALFVEFLKLYSKNKEAHDCVCIPLAKVLKNVVETDAKYGTKLVRDALNEFPGFAETFLISLASCAHSEEVVLPDKEKQMQKMSMQLQKTKVQLKNREKEIELIKSSKLWKFRRQIVGLFKS